MRHRSLLLRPAFCVLLLAIVPGAKAEKLVVSRSTVSSEYLRKRLVDGIRQPETYVFMAGSYAPGQVRDRSLDRISFRTIAERLAQDLRPQDFHPARSLAEANLLLVVHWGVTTGTNRDTVAIATSLEALANIGRFTEQAEQDLDAAQAAGDIEAVMRTRGTLDSLQGEFMAERKTIEENQATGGESNARLLGLSEEMKKDDGYMFGSNRMQTLFDMTQEERYFIVVMAYDAQTFIRTQQLKRVWTTRTSIRSAGVNFPQALDRMGNVASRYFGTRQDGLAFDRTGDRPRKDTVRFGDITVLGTVER